MAKKKEIAEVIWYKTKTNLLYLADSFMYESIVYEVHSKSSLSMCEITEKESKEFKIWNTTKNIEKGKRKFIQFIQLVGAPLNFLEEHKFVKMN